MGRHGSGIRRRRRRRRPRGPLARLGADDQRAKLAFSLGSLGMRLGGDTGRYDTVNDPAGGLDLPGLQRRLAEVSSPDRPVTLLLAGDGRGRREGADADRQGGANEGGGAGAVFAIEKPEDIADVYVTMLLRRLPS